MSTDHNRIKVADLEKNQPNKILKTNQNGELEFSDATIQVENYNALDYTTEGKALDARQGKVLKEMIDNIKSPNNLSTTEVLNLVKDNKLIPGDYYLINDFQTIYTINGSDSTPPTYPRLITSYVSGYATLDAGYDYVLIVGKQVKITKLPTGYSGSLQIGQTTTISEVASNYYFKFANGMQNLMGLEFSYTTPRYSNGIPDNLVVNDSNGKPVIRPGGVLNIEVHNNTPYMNMTATENLGVPMESIMLKAKSTNEFELEGKSVTYTDDVIEYQLPTDGDIAVKGKILRRYNNALNIDIRDDWRVKRYRRWKIDSASILKVLNQDQAVTSLTGFNGVYQFTATKSSSATPDRFYIASDLDSKSITLDEFTRVTNFTLATLSYTSAKDYPIFSLDSSHNPVNVSRMKVSGYFGNTVIQRNLGELNFSTNIDVEVLSNSTFVCSFVSEGKFIKIYDSLFLDTLQIASIFNSNDDDILFQIFI
ncbi:hypothetical protein ACQ9BO_13500 [Flavobacterium sp. P21]|uniref:hypothetical protein n=1 Tax=Flavobacterium sp. P21 TaxID=3423948 RepID=UPI003D673F52